MQKLVISLHFLMYKLCHNQLLYSDLADALFIPGCTREHALSPTAEDMRHQPLAAAHPEKYAVVVSHMLAAEGDHRICWKQLNETMGYAQLAEFLATRGIIIPPDRLAQVSERAYTHQGVRNLCAGLPLDVQGWQALPRR